MVIPFPGRQAAPRPAEAPAPFADVVRVFLIDLKVEGRAAWTLRKHLQELRRFARWLDDDDRTWRGVAEDDLRAYVATRAHLGSSSRGATICTLHVFYTWAVGRRLITTSPAAQLTIPTRPKPTPKALTTAQIRQLVSYLAEQQGLRARRDEALVLTALYTGLRAAELARLRWGDLDLDAGVLTIELSKANHGRVVALHADLIELLRRWKETQGQLSDAPIFGSIHDGRPITPGRVGKIMRRIKEETGLPLHTHKLRHSFATWTLRKSKDLFAVSKALGHKQLKQTEVYIQAAADVEQIAEAVAMLPGLRGW